VKLTAFYGKYNRDHAACHKKCSEVSFCLNIKNEVVEVKLRVSQMIHKTVCLCLFTKFLLTSKVVK
jgi:hypothetical protein